MKSFKTKHLLSSVIAAFVLLNACSKMEMALPAKNCTSSDVINLAHPKALRLQEKLDEVVKEGVPGITMAIKDSNGTWASASGLSKIETNESMEICHLQFGQSVAKTYMATAVLMLYESGKIDLDKKITEYLPESVTKDIANADQATPRMLLNHTSGIAEYNDHPQYVTYLLQHPLHTFTIDDYLDYVTGASPKFSPGEKHSYTNTNYILLALIVDQITGDHKKFIRDEILTAFDLQNTFYHHEGFMQMPELVNTYWDRYSNGKIENCSDMHRTNVGSLIGDDGVIATPVDYISFLEKLLTHQILKPSTMDEMLEFVQKRSDSPNGYGLGLHQEFYKGHEEVGHTGGGIGAGCVLGHFKDTDTYYFLGINLGTSIQPGAAEPLEEVINEIYDILVE